MTTLEFEHDIKVSTKFAEGVMNGLKFSVMYLLTFGVYYSKDEALATSTTFRWQFFKSSCKAILFFPLLNGAIYGQRQLVLGHRDQIIAKLHSIHPSFRKGRAATDLTLYFMMCAPLGVGVNYIMSGRLIRGSISLTLLIALFVRLFD